MSHDIMKAEQRYGMQGQHTDSCPDSLPLAAPLSLQHVAADFETFFNSSEDIAQHLNQLLTQTLLKELPWLSPKAQASTLGILLLLPHIQEVRATDFSCIAPSLQLHIVIYCTPAVLAHVYVLKEHRTCCAGGSVRKDSATFPQSVHSCRLEMP